MAVSDFRMDPLPGQLEPDLPSEEHRMRRDLARGLAANEVEPRAAAHDHEGSRLPSDAKPSEIGGGTLESHRKNLTRGLTRALTR